VRWRDGSKLRKMSFSICDSVARPLAQEAENAALALVIEVAEIAAGNVGITFIKRSVKHRHPHPETGKADCRQNAWRGCAICTSSRAANTCASSHGWTASERQRCHGQNQKSCQETRNDTRASRKALRATFAQE